MYSLSTNSLLGVLRDDLTENLELPTEQGIIPTILVKTGSPAIESTASAASPRNRLMLSINAGPLGNPQARKPPLRPLPPKSQLSGPRHLTEHVVLNSRPFSSICHPWSPRPESGRMLRSKPLQQQGRSKSTV